MVESWRSLLSLSGSALHVTAWWMVAGCAADPAEE
jgi:hypothetical protein